MSQLPSRGNFLTSGEVGRELGISHTRIVQLDAELRPELTPTGRRIYRREIIEAYAAARVAKRALRAATKRARPPEAE
jgi:hypothetical protein